LVKFHPCRRGTLRLASFGPSLFALAELLNCFPMRRPFSPSRHLLEGRGAARGTPNMELATVLEGSLAADRIRHQFVITAGPVVYKLIVQTPMRESWLAVLQREQAPLELAVAFIGVHRPGVCLSCINPSFTPGPCRCSCLPHEAVAASDRQRGLARLAARCPSHKQIMRNQWAAGRWGGPTRDLSPFRVCFRSEHVSSGVTGLLPTCRWPPSVMALCAFLDSARVR
jgi:hypothetical protein